MWKLLLKKQLQELFRGYFVNPKNNKARSKAGIVGMFLLYAVVLFGILGGMFVTVAMSLCPTLSSIGMGWMYFDLMGLIAAFLGVIGGVFSTYSSLYLAKDNDLLLSMPIPVSEIMKARLLSVFLMALLYSGLASVPAVFVYLVIAPFKATAIVGGIMFVVLVSVLVFLLSCVLGFVVAKVSLKIKNKSFITVFISIAFFAAYYYFYFRAQEILQDFLLNAAVYGEKLQKIYPLYLFGRMGEGDLIAVFVWTFVFALLTFGLFELIRRSFLKIVTSTGAVKKAVYKERRVKAKSSFGALLNKELKRFLASPAYMLNCGLGTLMLPVIGILLLMRGSVIAEALNEVFEMRESVTVIFTAVLCVGASMNIIATPSISLEGKNLWIAQSLPVTPWQVLAAKLMLHILLTGIPVLFGSICVMAVCGFSIFSLITELVFVVLCAVFDLFLGLKMPNLHWTSEAIVVKQSMSVFIAMFGGMLFAIAIAVGFFLVGYQMGADLYFVLLSVIMALIAGGLFLWLKRKGTKEFAGL